VQLQRFPLYFPSCLCFSAVQICVARWHFTGFFLIFNWRIKNQLDATWYFIVLLIGSACFGHYYAHHQELATIMLITVLVVSFLVCCRLEFRLEWCPGCRLKHESYFSLQPGHYSSLPAPRLQPTANQERNDQFVNQNYSRELLMMGIVMPETCWAYKKYNKISSGI
jgi:hypothetical protein